MGKKIIAKQVEQTIESTEKPLKVKPVIIKHQTVAPAQNTEVHADIEIPEGHAYVVPLIDGREDQTQAFFYPLRNVNKVFGNADRFIIKKKTN